ncbi:MAG: protein translocase SEC61 complex subunit gamma [Candidatus Norongarragalinales archaeon]
MSVVNVKESLESFVTQSKRVIAITHKPGQAEYKQMSLTTAIGMTLIGLTGFVVAMLALLLKGKF